jgi:MoxR-like ATPase
VEFEGTYPLPEAQRDRFLMKVFIDYPTDQDEAGMLQAYASGNRLHAEAVAALQPVLTRDELVVARETVRTSVRAEEGLQRYVLALARATRSHDAVQIGAGPRATLALLECGRARAALQGRDFMTPDDVKAVAHGVLAHRVLLTPEAEMEGLVLNDLVRRILDGIEVPR